MKVGDIIGAGDGTLIGLTCSIESIQGKQIDAWVINGEWNITFFLDNRATICHSPEGPRELPRQKIMTTFPIPKGLNYNEQLEYMNKQFSSSPIIRYTTGKLLMVRMWASKIQDSLAAASVAFKKTWKGEPEDISDSDIPF